MPPAPASGPAASDGPGQQAPSGRPAPPDDPAPPGRRPVRVTVVGRPGCHLCEVAETVVERVTAELGVGWENRSIDDDPDLHDRYWEQIPVVFVDGRQHDFYTVSEDRLRAALRA